MVARRDCLPVGGGGGGQQKEVRAQEKIPVGADNMLAVGRNKRGQQTFFGRPTAPKKLDRCAPAAARQLVQKNEQQGPLRKARIIIMLGLIPALLCLLAARHVTSMTSADTKQQQQQQLIRHELRFQNELDNSTVIKHVGQQQTFKCQARLAPLMHQRNQQQQQQQQRSRLKSSTRFVELTGQQSNESPFAGGALDARDNNQQNSSLNVLLGSHSKWPPSNGVLLLANASIAIDWFKNERKLTADNNDDDQVTIINVTLNKTSSTTSSSDSSIGSHRSARFGQAAKSSRIEIKNTLNSNQLKLASRLKLTALKVTDTATYKCQARAHFSQVNLSATWALNVEQVLDSNHGAHLSVLDDSSTMPLGQFDSRVNSISLNANEQRPAKPSPMAAGRQHQLSQQQQQQQDAVKAHTIGAPSPTASAGNSIIQAAGQFDDDEDLFARLDQGQEIVGVRANDEAEPNTNWQPASATTIEHHAYNDWLSALNGDEEFGGPLVSARHRFHQQMLSDFGPQTASGAQIATNNNNEPDSDESESSSSYSTTTLMNEPTNEAHQQQQNKELPSGSGQNRVPASANQRNRMDNNEQLMSARASPSSWRPLAKLVHHIAPELSCYTGSGEHYSGNVSTSIDARPCLHWSYVRHLLARYRSNGTNAMASGKPLFSSNGSSTTSANNNATPTRASDNLDHHNYCRNPNMDPRGPWCFVMASSSSKGTNAPTNANGQLFQLEQHGGALARAPCNIPACSEYLWLTIVAPPLGLMLLIICTLILLFKSIKKVRRNKSVFVHHQHRNKKSTSFDSDPTINSNAQANTSCLLDVSTTTTTTTTATATATTKTSSRNNEPFGLCRLFKNQANRLLALKCGSKTSKSASRKKRAKKRANNAKIGNYLDQDDIFEIVDDIDWSDGSTVGGSSGSAASNQLLVHSQSFSPKSGESMRLNHSSPPLNTIMAPPSDGVVQRPTLSQCKMINQLFNDKRVDPFASKCLTPTEKSSNQQVATNGNQQNTTSNGPMFATLRCHVRGTANQTGRRAIDSAAGASKQNESNKNSNSILDPCDLAVNHLSQVKGSVPNGNNNTSAPGNDKTILANQLAQLSAANISILYDVQPIFEGKFSQVQMAYMKQQQDDSTQATGMIGTQVAVCALKQQAAVDKQLFEASRLRLRNLNHLNLIKLIGYIICKHEDSSLGQETATPYCALIYDMSHLMDLSDWLREQSKDSVFENMSADSSSLRQNITCFAKQIALALDYLHDRDIIYRDLACRNCFLDVTKMLVKLASFNLELGVLDDAEYSESILNDTSNQRLNLKCMIRPKYLLDYYVIDSRPSECQLLPLSWIPLESILFNKFNKQTDIWSFGCLLYELFSLGEVAFFGYSSKQVIDSVRSNLKPPQPLLCPNGIYKLMCKCLSDIPTLRPNVKQIYEQLNLYSGQCSSFLDHHLCSLATFMGNNRECQVQKCSPERQQILATSGTGSMTKTKSYANIVTKANQPGQKNLRILGSDGYDIPISNEDQKSGSKAMIPMSKSINIVATKLASGTSSLANVKQDDKNQYDEPILTMDKSSH